MKFSKKVVVWLIAAVMLLSVPAQVMASSDIGFFGFGNTIVSSLPKPGNTETTTKIKKENIKITTTSTEARLNFDASHMIYKIKEYNLLLNKWEDINFINNSTYLQISNLSPNTFHKIKVTAGKRVIGVYTFTTKPANIKKINSKVTEEDITLTWSNPDNYTTQVYKRMLTPEEIDEIEKAKLEAEEAQRAKEEAEKEEETTRPGEFYAEMPTEEEEETTVLTFDDLSEEEQEKCKWKLVCEVKDTKYVDTDVEGGNYYYYKVRYVCKTKQSTQYSDFRHYNELLVPLEEEGILKIDGFTIIRQNDPVNRLVAYPFTKGDGRTIGTSGCGVCAALMVIRNTSDYDTSLEDFTKEVIKAGGRVAVGSDLDKISKLMKSKYHYNYEYTNDIDKLKEHLRKGYMCVANVGASKYFSNGGHFVTIAGITTDENGEEVAIVLDPSFRESKYNEKHRKEAGLKYTEDGIVFSPFKVIKDDGKMLHYALYTPEDAEDTAKSE
ncbi:MAG: C39 family peptidase [Eubacterium sp.]|nr:C39 family peptidase [Eubacterium sp.]MBR0412178.1 C39 family peptidase [Eubacterium sp.]